MKPVIILFALFAMTGCAEYRAVVADRGAQAADDALIASEWGHCKAATAASLERKYHLYSDICATDQKKPLRNSHGQQIYTEIKNDTRSNFNVCYRHLATVRHQLYRR